MTVATSRPPVPIPMPRCSAVVERNLLVARRMWPVQLSGFSEAAFYLAAVGLGVGAFVAPVAVAPGRTVEFSAYVAPALLAASAMNGAVFESTINFFWKLRYQKVYDVALASPLTIRQLVLGEIGWAQLRGVLYAMGFLVIMMLAGWADSAWALLAVPATVLIGLAFGALGTAVTTFMRTWQDMELVTLGQQVMFFCSATFFPVSVYPPALQFVVRATPLYHANELVRSLCIGLVTPALLGHVAYLAAVAALGIAVASRRVERILRR